MLLILDSNQPTISAMLPRWWTDAVQISVNFFVQSS